MIKVPSERPELFWEGINDGFYALEGEQVSIDCKANVGSPGGTLEISLIRDFTIGASSSRLITSEPVSSGIPKKVNGVRRSHTGFHTRSQLKL